MNYAWARHSVRENLLWSEEYELIRQAISCDICASEKRQTNHWFVAYEQGGELRVSGWSSRHKLRPGSKHLCGQTCLHKLVDEFIAKAIAVRAQRPTNEVVDEVESDSFAVVDASLTSDMAHTRSVDTEMESSARLVTPAALVPPPAAQERPTYRPEPEIAPTKATFALALVATPDYQPQLDPATMPPLPQPGVYAPAAEDPPRFNSRNWRAAAWEREREREMRAVGNRHGITTHRASNS